MTEYEKQKLTFVSKDLRGRIETVVLDCLDKAQKRFGISKVQKIPEIRYDTIGKAAGWACWNSGNPFIRINPILLNENVEQVVNQTVPHEVAHVVVNEVYENARVRDWNNRRQIAPHGTEWKSVMRLFGKEPDRCHQMDTSTVQKIRGGGNRFVYKCNCREHDFTINRHNKVSFKGMVYRCALCKGDLKFNRVVND